MMSMPLRVTHTIRTMLAYMMLDVMALHAVTRLCIGSRSAQHDGYNGKCGDK
jgi:hypothetical protein